MSDSQRKSEDRQFLEAIALQLNLTGDTLETFLKRFDQENATKDNSTLVNFITWNRQPEEGAQKLQDELARVCEILEKSGCPTGQKKRGRAPKGQSPWEQAYKWLWESQYPEWQQQNQQPISEQGEIGRNSQADIDALVQEVRSRLHPIFTDPNGSIGTLRVLGVNRPVLVDQQIYIDLNVVERLSCEWHFSQWPQANKSDNRQWFDRQGVGLVEQERVDAIATVAKSSRLLMLGKPGAGKTTFLKALAVKCIQPDGDLFADRVPFFVTLREFAREAHRTDSWLLKDYLVKLAAQQGCGLESVREVLEQGRSLLLLDGLDEVPPENLQSVLDAVQDLQYSQNLLVITCRTQGHGSANPFWDAFTRVEAADFTPEQTDRFIVNWFNTAAPTAKASLVTDLQRQLREEKNRAIAALAVTPILLSLICAVFRDEQGTLPQRRSDLYAKGIRLLLERSQRSSIDSRLTFDKKEEFLATLALKLFQDNNYFPTEETLVAFIKPYFQMEGAAARQILKAFETETGLLIERSAGYWSFSHLTFHEYFTAREIMNTVNLSSLEKLATQIAETRWREVFLLTTEMLKPVDRLLHLMKHQIDELLAGDDDLQQFLVRIEEKTKTIASSRASSRELAIARAFYFHINRSNVLDLPVKPDSFPNALDRKIIFGSEIKLIFVDNLDFTIDYELALLLYNIYCLAANPPYLNAESYSHIRKTILNNLRNLSIQTLEFELETMLEEFKKSLPVLSEENWEDFKEWSLTHGEAWANKLRRLLVEYRKIRHDLRGLTEIQGALLQSYHDSHLLLIDCLDRDHVVSETVRNEIEDTLLLPIAHIKQRSKETQ